MEKEKKGLNINAKSFLTAIIVIFALMLVTYILSLVIPGGEYTRVDENGIIDQTSYQSVDGGIPFWKWILSPILLLGAEGSITVIAVIAFLLIIGGIFNALDKSGIIKHMLGRITVKFGKSRYKLMAIVVLFFMALGALAGSFEEIVPLVPIVVTLAISLGWDAITGIGMSVLAVGCGFSAGICNPFTIGVAQELAGLAMFSGVWLRIMAFVLIYGLLYGSLYLHAKKIEKPVDTDKIVQSFTTDKKKDLALILFATILGIGIVTTICCGFIPSLKSYTMIIVGVMFLIAGIVSSLVSGMSFKSLCKTFANGVVSILPAVLMILMASSISYTMKEAHILHPVIRRVIGISEGMPKWALIFFIYLIVLVINFFIPSGSAKAVMLIPLIMPIANTFGLSMQLCIVAFAFSDGFSDVLYPTSPALLISLGLAKTSYGKWVKWSWKFQLVNLLLSLLILLLGFAVGY